MFIDYREVTNLEFVRKSWDDGDWGLGFIL